MEQNTILPTESTIITLQGLIPGKPDSLLCTVILVDAFPCHARLSSL